MDKKGFTLVELLIVIGILGILAAAVVVVLNPAELLAQSRDSSRMQDMANLNAALALYNVSTTAPVYGTTAYHSQATTTVDTCGSTGATPGLAAATYRDVDGTGWVAVNLSSLTGGAPMAVLPVDPTNDTTYYYCYDADNTTKQWELLSQAFESTKFGTTLGIPANDGGDDPTSFEVGTFPGLALM